MTPENLQTFIPKHVTATLHGNAAIFEVSTSEIIEVAKDLYNNKNLPLQIITAIDETKERGGFKIMYVFAVPKENIFLIPFITLRSTNAFPSLTPTIHEACNYERKIKTFFGLNPIGHPDPRPFILHDNWPSHSFPLRKDFDWKKKQEKAHARYDFQKVEGEGIYEIPVGPIHAGIIEPGHFRFSVAGEEIVFLEPRLGFTHKGSEKLFEILSLHEKVRLSEKISGDSSFSHSLAFCQALELASDIVVPARGCYLRLIYAELERLANHFGDIGFIMLDTGFNFGGAHLARLREMIMQINERLTSNRFLRGVNTVGGVTKDITKEEQHSLFEELKNIIEDFSEVIDSAEDSASLLNRLKNTGILSREIAQDYGVIGIAGKAVGIKKDARIDYPYAVYDKFDFEISTEKSGDVYARFHVRIKEIYSSFKLIEDALKTIPEEKQISFSNSSALKKNTIAVSIVEGWRGNIVYFLSTDSQGNINRVDIRDPSFLNWSALPHAAPGNIVPDFPLINKSFNLSYSGNDL